MIPTFQAIEWFHIARGDVAVVPLHEDTPREELAKKLQTVVIDGHEYTPIGVESYAIQTIRAGMIVGILVKERVK